MEHVHARILIWVKYETDTFWREEIDTQPRNWNTSKANGQTRQNKPHKGLSLSRDLIDILDHLILTTSTDYKFSTLVLCIGAVATVGRLMTKSNYGPVCVSTLDQAWFVRVDHLLHTHKKHNILSKIIRRVYWRPVDPW